MKNFSGSQDHRLETLESRSLLSGTPDAAPAPMHEVAVVVADAAFLNASSQQAAQETAGSVNDNDMYEFGGSWGTQALAEHVQASNVQVNNVDLDNGAVDQEPGGGRRVNPADLSPVVPATYGRAAEYRGDAPVITANLDPIAADAPSADEPVEAPVVTAPVVEQPSVARIADVNAVVAPSGNVGIVWLETPGTVKKTDGVAITDTVVITSTFLSH